MNEDIIKILTINDWWDGPVIGICEYNGHHYIYERNFDLDKKDKLSYTLVSITRNELEVILKDWKKWVRAVEEKDLDNYYKNKDNSRKTLMDKIIKDLKNRETIKIMAKFSGKYKKGYIPINYIASISKI